MFAKLRLLYSTIINFICLFFKTKIIKGWGISNWTEGEWGCCRFFQTEIRDGRGHGNIESLHLEHFKFLILQKLIRIFVFMFQFFIMCECIEI